MSSGPMNSGIESIWTVEQTADYLKMSTSWVYKQAECGALPCIRMGGSLRFASFQVKRFVQERMSTGFRR